MNSTVEWKGDMLFNATSGTGHSVLMDSSADHGGKDQAARPKEYLLHGLAGCTGMDVVSILKKMRVEPKAFRLEVTADQTEEHPMIFKNIHIKYLFSGDVDHEKIKKAVDLSQTKYCGVSEMFKRFANVTFEIVYES